MKGAKKKNRPSEEVGYRDHLVLSSSSHFFRLPEILVEGLFNVACNAPISFFRPVMLIAESADNLL